MNSRTLASGLLLLALIGCRRAAPPAYTPSEAVAAFATYGEDDDQRRMWSLLQEKIGQALRQRCGAPLQPVMLAEEEFDRRHLARGAAVYQRRCVQCHGVDLPPSNESMPVARILVLGVTEGGASHATRKDEFCGADHRQAA